MRRFIAIVLMLLALGCLIDSAAQNVERQGNTFVQKKSEGQTKSATKTSYVYKDNKGNSYPVYLSAKGKAFIIKVSKKTGKEYKQYMPEIGKQINPQAYKEE